MSGASSQTGGGLGPSDALRYFFPSASTVYCCRIGLSYKLNFSTYSIIDVDRVSQCPEQTCLERRAGRRTNMFWAAQCVRRRRKQFSTSWALIRGRHVMAPHYCNHTIYNNSLLSGTRKRLLLCEEKPFGEDHACLYFLNFLA